MEIPRLIRANLQILMITQFFRLAGTFRGHLLCYFKISFRSTHKNKNNDSHAVGSKQTAAQLAVEDVAASELNIRKYSRYLRISSGGFWKSSNDDVRNSSEDHEPLSKLVFSYVQ